MQKFGEVEVLHGPNGADVDINAKNSLDNSGSNETLQNALASIVKLSRIFEIFFMFQTFLKFELLCFLSDLGEICYGVTLGKEQHRMCLKWLRLFFDLEVTCGRRLPQTRGCLRPKAALNLWLSAAEGCT